MGPKRNAADPKPGTQNSQRFLHPSCRAQTLAKAEAIFCVFFHHNPRVFCRFLRFFAVFCASFFYSAPWNLELRTWNLVGDAAFDQGTRNTLPFKN